MGTCKMQSGSQIDVTPVPTELKITGAQWDVTWVYYPVPAGFDPDEE